jgi:rhamnosyltransferase
MTPACVEAPDVAEASVAPGVSILLLTKNHRKDLEANFDRIQGQDYGGAEEYIHIDSGSTDGTIEFMRERGIETHCIPPEEFHHARTRNLAASMARYGILVCLSVDAVPANSQWLRKLVRPFEDVEVGAVYGKQVAPKGTGPLRVRGLEYQYPNAREVRQSRKGERIPLGYIRFSNANSAVRTEVWRRFKFHENVLVAEDHWLCYNVLKSGMKVVYEPEAAVIHGHERSIWEEFQFAVDNGVSLKRMGVFDDPDVGGEFRYGMHRIWSDWRHFTSQGQYGLAAQSLLVSSAKWAGVQLGKREAHLPHWLLKRISEVHKKIPMRST